MSVHCRNSHPVQSTVDARDRFAVLLPRANNIIYRTPPPPPSSSSLMITYRSLQQNIIYMYIFIYSCPVHIYPLSDIPEGVVQTSVCMCMCMWYVCTGYGVVFVCILMLHTRGKNTTIKKMEKKIQNTHDLITQGDNNAQTGEQRYLEKKIK